MGAIWAARDLCLFLLLLNSHRSRALPEIRGGTVVSVCACMRACVHARARVSYFLVATFTLLFLSALKLIFIIACFRATVLN